MSTRLQREPKVWACRHLSDLPAAVRHELPDAAQQVYMAVFNSVFVDYVQAGAQCGDETPAETAHRMAWAAVAKAGFVQDTDGRWRRES